MIATKQCPECGASLSDDSPETPCLACLMKIGLATWQGQTEQAAVEGIEPTNASSHHLPLPDSETLAAEFPGLEIIELLGRGGMGAVYKARQNNLDRFVALKVIDADSDRHPGFADRFSREARALAHLNHPNIVTVHDFGRTDSYFYLTMEYVDGVNLREMLRENELDPQAALAIVPDVCDALQYAHDEGIVHRDIKPENILVDKRGRVKIADFGLAKLLGDHSTDMNLTRTNQVMGTLHYMAPEQVERPLAVDHRADIYSLGVVIYELLTGELPLGRFAPPSRKVQVNVKLDEIVLQTLEKEPGLRYQRVSDVKSDMQSVADASKNSPAANTVPVKYANAKDRSIGARPEASAKPPKAGPTPSPSRPQTPEPLAFVLTAENIFGVILKPQTYLNLFYLLSSFPLGIAYFVILVTGLSVGVGTLIIWIGFFVLLATLIATRAIGEFERIQAERVLGVQVPTHFRQPVMPTMFGRIKGMLSDYTTWTTMLFAFLKFPLGIVAFSTLISLLATSVAAIGSVALYQLEWVDPKIGDIHLESLTERAIVSVLGIILLFVSLHLLNALAWCNGQLARLLLRRTVDAG